jgi:hypothetical protein
VTLDPSALVADLQAYVAGLTDDEFDSLLADTRDDDPHDPTDLGEPA